MSSYRVSGAIAAGAGALAIVATLAAALPRSGSVREVRLVARQMAYYVEGQSTPNPTLRFRRGERVRIVVKNEDPGMIHDFGVDAWDARTPRIKPGDAARLTFTVPPQPGETAYACTPHGQMMRGTMTVE